ncbi:copper resistance protein CopC [Plantactinospora veratri]|uniref:Copper resistance protein CopC n=1 Tax=Plantactinospora veratri TaxID=1436122 RepID=A0ABU7SK63_9ACTN
MGRAAPRLLAAVLLGLLTVPLGAVDPRPAYAHGQLAVSTPADGATLTAPVESVSLAFTEQPAPFAYFTVTAPNGSRVDRRWSTGTPIRLDEPVREYQLVNGAWEPRLFHVGFTVQVPVAYWPEQGRYVVRYQTVASDGEEVDGEVRFSYTGASTPAPAGWQAPTDQPSPELAAAAGHGRPTAPASAPPSAPPSAPAAPTAAERGPGVSVWLVPAVLVIGAAVLVAGVARRPARPARPAHSAGSRRAGPTPTPNRRRSR